MREYRLPQNWDLIDIMFILLILKNIEKKINFNFVIINAYPRTGHEVPDEE